MEISCLLGTTHRVPQEKFPPKPYNNPLLTKFVLHLLRTQILCPGHKICFWFCSETFCVCNKCFPVCAAQETSWAAMCPRLPGPLGSWAMTTVTAVITPQNKRFNEQKQQFCTCFKFCYISLPSSVKHQIEMTKFKVLLRTWTHDGEFFIQFT